MTPNTEMTVESAVEAFNKAFDVLYENAKQGLPITFVLYQGSVATTVPLEEWTVRNIVNRPEMHKKNVGFVPVAEELILGIINYDTQIPLGEIYNPPLSLLDELRSLTK